MRCFALAFLPLLACTADDGLSTPKTVARVAGPQALIASGDRAFIATDDGLYSVDLDGRPPTRIASEVGAVAMAPDGITLDYAEAPAGIAELDTRDLATHPLVGDVSGVQAIAVTHNDLYWIDQYLDVNHSPQTELCALDLRTGVVRVVAASLLIDDLYLGNRIALVADDSAAYVRTNRTLARYDRTTGELRVLASKLGVASGLAIEGSDLYVVDGNLATRISLSDGAVHALGQVRGDVEGIVVDGGVVTIATSEADCGFADNCSDDARNSWLFETNDSGVQRTLAYRPSGRIIGLALTPGSVLFAERAANGGPGAVLSLPR